MADESPAVPVTGLPEPLVDLDLRTLRVRIEREDGDLVLVLDDGDTSVRLNPGVGGSRADAVLGAERAVRQLTQYVGLLTVQTIRRGRSTPLRPEDAP